jgi:hypothetical protein
MFFIILFIFSVLEGSIVQEKDVMEEALQEYGTGMSASSYLEQNNAFNRSIALASQVQEKKGANELLGDNLFQFKEYPWAILFYSRAWKENRENSQVKAKLEHAQKELGLSSDSFIDSSWKERILSPFVFISILGILFLFCSWMIWAPGKIIQRLFWISLLLMSMWSVFFLYRMYFTPLEAIIVRSSEIYRYPSFDSSQVVKELLLGGSKIQIVGMAAEGEWVKIIDVKDVEGYVPASSVRAITVYK